MKRHTPAALALLLACGLASGCSPSSDGVFDARATTASRTCQAHQTQQPGHRYTAGPGADTESILMMMRYYTANGTKTFCDGHPPTPTDVRWMDLYQALGGEPAHIGRPASAK
ncbi:hypothetical protein OG500_01930 [Kitasatospora sp. NBC_01250]|uniref:hypothetical protein n=1 Tax=unclassified Kitasatospora TaxID=2633591 RepID=UPI002E1022E9|nr:MULTISPECIES: hypothetical protein [unclassified Kitasatospora]WSJ64946.1 hypothetical protein OG294_01860 [Kitasatospora sp. NBC_01302]